MAKSKIPHAEKFEVALADDSAAANEEQAAPANAPEAKRIERVELARITTDEKLVCRANGVNAETVRAYSQRMQEGTEFEPVVLFHDAATDVLWLADGNHRFAGTREAGLTEILAEIRRGDWHAALVYAATANDRHGMRATNKDKRFVVNRFLDIYKGEVATARWIAERCGVSHTFVSNVIAERAGKNAVPPVPTDGLATVATPEELGKKGKKARALDAERETAKLAKHLETLAKAVGDDPGARSRLAALLRQHAQQLGGTKPTKAGHGARAAKQTNGAASTEASA